jgi:hypothetical protein
MYGEGCGPQPWRLEEVASHMGHGTGQVVYVGPLARI